MITTLFLGSWLLAASVDDDVAEANAFLTRYRGADQLIRKEMRSGDAAHGLIDRLSRHKEKSAAVAIGAFLEYPEFEIRSISGLMTIGTTEAQEFVCTLFSTEKCESQSLGQRLGPAKCPRYNRLRVLWVLGLDPQPRLSPALVNAVAASIRTETHDFTIDSVLQTLSRRLVPEGVLGVLDVASHPPALDQGLGIFDESNRAAKVAAFLETCLKNASPPADGELPPPPVPGLEPMSDQDLARVHKGLLERAGDAKRPEWVRVMCLRQVAARRVPGSAESLANLVRTEESEAVLLVALESSSSSRLPDLAAALRDSLPRLEKTFAKKNSSRRGSVALMDALWTHRIRAAAPLVLKHAKSKRSDVRFAAIRALPLCAEKDAEALLKKLLSDKDWRLQRAAVEGCRRLGNATAVDLLISRMSKTHGRIRLELLASLLELTGQSFPNEIAAWKRWWLSARSDFATTQPLAKGTHRIDPKSLEAASALFAQDSRRLFGKSILSSRVAIIVDGALGMRRGRPNKKSHLDRTTEELSKFLGVDAAHKFNMFIVTREHRRLFPRLVPQSRSSVARLRKFLYERFHPDRKVVMEPPLREALSDPATDTVVIFTAGWCNDAAASIAAAAELDPAGDVPIHVFSFGGAQLRPLAESSNGEYVFVR